MCLGSQCDKSRGKWWLVFECNLYLLPSLAVPFYFVNVAALAGDLAFFFLFVPVSNMLYQTATPMAAEKSVEKSTSASKSVSGCCMNVWLLSFLGVQHVEEGPVVWTSCLCDDTLEAACSQRKSVACVLCSRLWKSSSE